MTKDTQIRDDIQHELFYSPGVNAAAIVVAVQDGVVTLTGEVDTYGQKLEAVRAAERISEVKAVASRLQVKLPGPYERRDTDLATAAANVLAWNSLVPAHWIRITVENAWIRLDGTVAWQYQKEAAGAAVAVLTGVRGVNNQLSIHPLASEADTRHQIEAALKRSAAIIAINILVEVHHDKVALYGEVRSIPERDEAERIAWSAPGVADVTNHLAVCQSVPAASHAMLV
jgi:osmotically-inducible protein OsmY